MNPGPLGPGKIEIDALDHLATWPPLVQILCILN